MREKLFNPFLRIAGLKAFSIGLLFLTASTLLAWIFQTSFDGVLDVHYGLKNSLETHIIMNLIDVGCLVLVFYLLAIILTKGKTRFVDILGTMTLARFPLILAPFLNIGGINSKIGDKIIYGMQDRISEPVFSSIHCMPCTVSAFEYIYLVLSILVVLLIIVWYVALLYRAYIVSANLKGSNAIVSFIAGIILAEAVSSIFIHYLS